MSSPSSLAVHPALGRPTPLRGRHGERCPLVTPANKECFQDVRRTALQGSCSGSTTPRFSRAAAAGEKGFGSWPGSRQTRFEARAAHLPSSILAATTPLTLESPGAGTTSSSPGRHRALLERLVPLHISGGARRTISLGVPPEVQVRRFRTRRPYSSEREGPETKMCCSL